ncbi:MAG: TetR/AcrR family transcriptional regulator [Spirochaetota bacterium]|nr:TetR/AcrR family transcriptional regulator [Spirochaetota bacterium]
MPDDKDQVKTRILDSAKKRFEHYGYHKTTVEEIADDAGIGKGTVYLHFRSKQDIFIELTIEFFEVQVKECESIFKTVLPIKERITKLIKARFLSIYEYCLSVPHGHEITQFIHSLKDDFMNISEKFRNRMDRLIMDSIVEGNNLNILNVRDPEKVSIYLPYCFVSIVSHFTIFKSKEDVEDYIDTVVDLFYEGMRAR